MSDRIPTEMVAEILPEPPALSEVRRIIQDAVDLLRTSREDAIQQIIETVIIEQRPRSASEIVKVIVGGIDRAQGRVILNYAHSWDQKPVDQLLSGRGGVLSDLDEDSIRAETLARDLNIDKQQAAQVLRIAREEAARMHQ